MGKNIDENISKNLSSKYSQKLLDYTKEYATHVLKTVSKRATKKTAEATGELIGNKIADAVPKSYNGKITKVSKISPPNSSETNKHDNEITKERYISSEERQNIIDDLRLI